MKYYSFPFGLFILLTLCVRAIKGEKSPILYDRRVDFSTNGTYTGVTNETESFVYTSQDFQVVISKSQKLPSRRVVIFGNACSNSNTSLERIQELNGNNLFSSYMNYLRDNSNIALIQRGDCNWSEKISTINQFAVFHNLSISAAFIYDNQSYPGISIEGVPTTGSGSRNIQSYKDALPDYRAYDRMADNDISDADLTLYFLPYQYGSDLVSRISRLSSLTDKVSFYLVTPYFTTITWGSASYEKKKDFKQKYIGYVVAAGVAVILSVLVVQFWVRRRIRIIDTEMNALRGPIVKKFDPLPVGVINKLPIEQYTEDLVKNENCPICIEDYEVGKTDVRILPCGHGFCVLCIDPWLSQKSCLCPICKWDCLPSDLRARRNAQEELENEQIEAAIQENNTENHLRLDEPEILVAESSSQAVPPVKTQTPSLAPVIEVKTTSESINLPQEEIVDLAVGSSSHPEDSVTEKPKSNEGTSRDKESKNEKKGK